jgi:hypothetical protein
MIIFGVGYTKIKCKYIERQNVVPEISERIYLTEYADMKRTWGREEYNKCFIADERRLSRWKLGI